MRAIRNRAKIRNLERILIAKSVNFCGMRSKPEARLIMDAAQSATRRARLRWDDVGGLIAVVAIILFARPYRGLAGDAALYVGHAVAALDSQQVGLDPMWALDGQMRFSIFPRLVETSVSWLGVHSGALALAFAGLCAWGAGLFVLANALGLGSSLVAVALAAMAFPAGYGAYGAIYFAEPLAVPRVFAEAVGLLALAALIFERRALFALIIAFAMLLHPLMATGALATGLAYVSLRDKRIAFFFVILALTGLVLVPWIGTPVLDPLTARMDAEWLQILRGPNDYLFPALWPQMAWRLKATQAISVALYAWLSPGVARRFFLSVLIAAGAGLAASIVLGDILSFRLAVQTQPWRIGWLLCVAAPIGFVLCARPLWRAGGTRRLSVFLMAAAWAVSDQASGPALALLAAGIIVGERWLEGQISEKTVMLIGACASFFVIAKFALELGAIHNLVTRAPAPAQPSYRFLLLHAHALAGPVALATVIAPDLLARFRLARATSAASFVAAICFGVSMFFWNPRLDPFRLARVGASAYPELEEMLSNRPGPVLWLGGSQEAWYWARRPNWAAPIQGNGIVFSRELTFLWFTRMRRLSALGWIADGETVSRGVARADPVFPVLQPEQIKTFCETSDAPSWIIAPTPTPNGEAIWRAPEPRYAPLPESGAYERIDLYRLIPCASGA
ncbi:MAG TPA: hypothetical protein VIF40_16150 [Methylosinus sp.]|jgi:hypothetical protein|uniref:hypothetical protein n=1 Tax=Methylosinus sp. TaxID=427 RepID=UPI002F93A1F9